MSAAPDDGGGGIVKGKFSRACDAAEEGQPASESLPPGSVEAWKTQMDGEDGGLLTDLCKGEGRVWMVLVSDKKSLSKQQEEGGRRAEK